MARPYQPDDGEPGAARFGPDAWDGDGQGRGASGAPRTAAPFDRVDPHERGGRADFRSDGPELKTLIRSLSRDLSQLAHDEMTLAKLELRSLTDTLSDDLKDAGQGLVKDFAKVGMALTLAMLAGLALTAGAILGIGDLLDAYWAGGLIVGVLLLIAAGVFGASAAKDLKTRDSLRLGDTRRRAEQNKAVLASEAKASKDFAKREASDFKEHASPGR